MTLAKTAEERRHKRRQSRNSGKKYDKTWLAN